MKITRLTVFRADLPLTHPYWLSAGRLKFESLDATLLKVDTDAGITGWGEVYAAAVGPGPYAATQSG